MIERMRRATVLTISTMVFAGAACGTSDRPPGLPGGGSGGGGGGGGGGAGADASAIDAPSAQIRGDLCELGDLRLPSVCTDGVDFSGVDIAIAGQPSILATASGSFEIPSSVGESEILELAKADVTRQPGLLEVALEDGGNAEVLAPVVAVSTWNDLKAALGVNEPSGTGTLAIYVRRGASPVAGAQVISSTAAIAPFYDGGGALDWSTDGLTGSAGAALLFTVPVGGGIADIEVVGPGGNPTVNVANIPVADGATSFVQVELP